MRGRRDYLVLAMNEGAIEFTVDNGRGPIQATNQQLVIKKYLKSKSKPIQATFQPGDKHEFCNGEVRSR